VRDDVQAYDAVWTDLFWSFTTTGMVFAPDLDAAIEQGLDQDADGLPIDSLSGPDGSVSDLSGGHTLRAARVLCEIDGHLVEETIGALTFEMALDLASLMVGDSGRVLGVWESATFWRSREVDEDFWQRSDLPVGWQVVRRYRR
jgi:hypothetical protein